MEIKKEKVYSVKEEFDEVLFEILRGIRRNIATKENVPPYIVFGDNTLKQMCIYYPNTLEKILTISGVGKNKLEKYGQQFVEEIQRYIISKENPKSNGELVADSKYKENGVIKNNIN